jgi:hypothetical protein
MKFFFPLYFFQFLVIKTWIRNRIRIHLKWNPDSMNLDPQQCLLLTVHLGPFLNIYQKNYSMDELP